MFGEKIRGPGMIVLQVIRVLTIISLLTAAAACWILVIKINRSAGWFFFEAMSLVLTSSATIFLIISELPFCKGYFQKNWPVFSDAHGLTWLGAGLLLIGSNILGKLNSPYNRDDKIGLPFWRLILAAGILTLTSGVLNIVCSIIFRDRDINARMIRADGSLARSRDDSNSFGKAQSNYTASFNDEQPKKTFMSFFWKKDDSKSSSLRRNISQPISRPHISHPMANDHDVERNAPANYHHERDDDSEMDRRSPIVPEVRRPDTALHPMNMRRPASPSMYSEARMSRF
ncbi:hypothetical protein NW752_007858 [Fusarium irregulare]|uniref:DUF7598 domain-containing protein n=1 Tax=Fusarium irregulare TaxID=2494466 RepID=A0A9W8U3T6_9HYPO|nr:hypothetical protein NW766_012639 [Fusarium irregulare]KAJ4013557.1 hypothetical protein NW752_007858 [Fusarium irregulare]